MIKITGGTASQKKHIPSVVNFCIQTLMPRMKNLDITVKIKDLSSASVYGFCTADPYGEAERGDRPRSFEIELHKNMSLRRVLETLCHEMVHVKQYARGELYQGIRVNKHRWQGKWVGDMNYWDEPWEIEAHGRETGLFVRWAESQGLGNKKWTRES